MTCLENVIDIGGIAVFGFDVFMIQSYGDKSVDCKSKGTLGLESLQSFTESSRGQVLHARQGKKSMRCSVQRLVLLNIGYILESEEDER